MTINYLYDMRDIDGVVVVHIPPKLNIVSQIPFEDATLPAHPNSVGWQPEKNGWALSAQYKNNPISREMDPQLFWFKFQVVAYTETVKIMIKHDHVKKYTVNMI